MVDLPQYVPTSRTGPAGAYAAAVSYRARPSAGGMKPVAASAACRSASGMGDAPGTRPRAGDGTLAMADCREAGECFGKDLPFLAKREPHLRLPRLLVVVEHRTRDGDHPCPARQFPAELHGVAVAQAAHVGGDEIRPGRPVDLEPGFGEAVTQEVPLAAEFAADRGVVGIRQRERFRHRVLERPAGHISEELLGRADRCHD